MNSTTRPRALVIGGSLGGLFAATSLRAIGWDVDVFERSPHDLDSRGGGVVLSGGAAAFRNLITQNSIYQNKGLGIDLNNNGVTLNDVGDGDTGANTLQNFPVITGAVSSGGATTITGTLNSTANTTFTLEYFASSAADATGFGEGQTYLGSTSVTTDGSGNVSFTAAGPITASQAADLSCASMRGFINCSEPVAAASHRRFLQRFESAGVTPQKLWSCYAMTENVFAVTQSPVDRPPGIDRVSRSVFVERHVAQPVQEAGDSGEGLAFVSCGRAIQCFLRYSVFSTCVSMCFYMNAPLL